MRLNFNCYISLWAWALVAFSSGTLSALELQEGQTLLPTLTLGFSYDDNLSQAADGQQQEESFIGTISPGILVRRETSDILFQGSYVLSHERYAYDNEDNHTDHELALDNIFKLNSRHEAAVSFDVVKRQDIRTSINRADPEESNGDRYNRGDIAARYTFGAKTARVQLEFETGHGRLRYDNNLKTLSQNRVKERNEGFGTATLYLRASPKSRILLEARQRNFNYIDSDSQLDNTARKYYIGAVWEATAKTEGSLRVGRERKSFESPSAIDSSEPAWDVSLTWSPRTYSRFRLFTSRGAAEGSVRSDAVETTLYSLSWIHDWSYSLSTDLTYSELKENYEGKTFDGRMDDTASYQAAITKRAGKKAEVTASYTRKERDSNSPIEEFDRDIVSLIFTVAI